MPGNITRISICLVAAAAAAATAFTLYEMVTDERGISIALTGGWILAFLIAFAHAFFLGLPSYFYLKRRHLTQWYVSVIGGFFIGCVPLTLISSPWHSDTNVTSLPESIPKTVGSGAIGASWPDVVGGILGTGLLGSIGALTAWILWRAMRPSLGSKLTKKAL